MFFKGKNTQSHTKQSVNKMEITLCATVHIYNSLLHCTCMHVKFNTEKNPELTESLLVNLLQHDASLEY